MTSPSYTPQFDPALVKHIAMLVRLGISDEEAQAFGRQFSDIIAYFNLLNEADLTGIEPAVQELAGSPPAALREDEPRALLARPAFLDNVPQHDGASVRVPTVTGVE